MNDSTTTGAVDVQTGLRDEEVTADERFLYAVDADGCRILGWAIATDGSLDDLGSWDGLPATVGGLAAG